MVPAQALRVVLGTLSVLTVSSVLAQSGPPATVPSRLPGIDRVVEAAIASGQTPGAVVLVGRGTETLHFAAYGQRATVPSSEPMSLDTVFDLASLTKVVATTTAVMTLVEQGRVRLSDPVSACVPGFERYGKGGVTVGHLMAHTSGLRPDLDLGEPWKGYDTAIDLARDEVLTAAPGERFIYSDINYFLLGEIVRVVSGEALRRLRTAGQSSARSGCATPGSCPGPTFARELRRPSAATRWTSGRASGRTPPPPRRRARSHCTPHGRRGRAMRACSGRRADLSRFARMLLSGGQLDGVRILAPSTVGRMTSRATPPGMTAVRGLGWDIDSSYSSPRGELFPIGSYGHTGFTGTSLWLDPASGGYVIILASRLHPDGGGDMTPLRARVATIAAAAMTDVSSAPRAVDPGAEHGDGAGAIATHAGPGGHRCPRPRRPAPD